MNDETDVAAMLAREAEEAERIADGQEALPDLSTLGVWVTPTQWEFFERVEFAPGMYMRGVDLGQMLTGKDVRADDLLMCFVLGGARQVSETVQMRAAWCSGCGQPGALPVDWPAERSMLCAMCAEARRA